MEAPEAQQAPETSAQRQLSRALSVEASVFRPATSPGKSGSPVKPVKTRDVFETLDYVPFTPSQGICTPSPSNVAQIWIARRAASGELPFDGSMGPGAASAAPLFHPSFFHPHMPYSPGAHAFHGFHGPGTPSHAGPWSPAGPAFFAPPAVASPGVAGAAAFVGSPAAPMVTPGRAIFAQYLAQEGYASGANSPGATSPPGGSSGSEGSFSSQKADNRSSDGEMNVKRSPGSRDAAAAWCAVRGIDVGAADPPAAIIELASLAMSYGITVDAAGDIAAAAAAFVSSSVSSSSSCSPMKMMKAGGGSVAAAAAAAQQQNTEAGGVRLNARQRRTLRRAYDRAMGALEAVLRGEDPATAGAALSPASFTTPVKGGGSSAGFGAFDGAGAAGGMVQAPMPVAFGSPAPMMWHSPVAMVHPHAVAQPHLVPGAMVGAQAAAAHMHYTAAAAAAAAAAAFHPHAPVQMGAMPVSPGPAYAHAAAAAAAAAQLHLQQQQQAMAAAGGNLQYYQQAGQQQQMPRSGGHGRRSVSRFAPAVATGRA